MPDGRAGAALAMNFTRRLLLGHKRTFVAAAIGVASFFVAADGVEPAHALHRRLGYRRRGAPAALHHAVRDTAPARMEANAEAQIEGEWTLFWFVVGGATASFIAIISEFGSMKDAAPGTSSLKVALVAGTLALSWLLTQVVFAPALRA